MLERKKNLIKNKRLELQMTLDFSTTLEARKQWSNIHSIL